MKSFDPIRIIRFLEHQKKISVILVFTLAAGFIFRFIEIANKHILDHDEAISYLAATCHQGSYNQAIESSLVGNWVQAVEWKKFVHIEHAFCFKQIGLDLAFTDSHPPLYFWLLHLWLLMLGVELWVGPSLNLLIAMGITLSLFGFASEVLANKKEAALVTFTWALNPGVILVSTVARHYDLLAFWTLLYTWLVIKFVNLNKEFNLFKFVSFAMVTSLGLLTHYYFLLLIVGCVVFTAVRLLNKSKRRLGAILTAVGVGIIGFILLHPYFYRSFQNQRLQATVFSYKEITIRLENVFWAFLPFFYVLGILAVLSIGVLIAYLRRPSTLAMRIHKTNFTGASTLFFLVWIAGAIIFLYLMLISPQHAMSHPRYLSMVWIFLAFIPVFILRFFDEFSLYLTNFFYLVPMLIAVANPLRPVTLNLLNPDIPYTRDPASVIRDADMIVVDNLARGIFPTIFWHMADDKLVFAAPQDYLLSHSDAWLGQLNNESIYISHISYESNLLGLKKNLKLVCQAHEVVLEQKAWELGYVFKIEEKSPDSPTSAICRP